jgi:hypothetical protein
MPWQPALLVLGVLVIAFDIWRDFDNNGVLGRSWPRIDRDKNPTAFWAIQAFRTVALILASLWGLVGFSSGR